MFWLSPFPPPQAGSIGNLFFDPMSSIGYGMIQLVRFMYGEAEYDPLAVSPGHRVKTAFGTMYFLLYVAVVLLLLCNVMIAMINRVYSTGWSAAEKQWRLRWAEYVLRWVQGWGQRGMRCVTRSAGARQVKAALDSDFRGRVDNPERKMNTRASFPAFLASRRNSPRFTSNKIAAPRPACRRR